MHYILMPASLKDASIIKLVIMLWSQSDIRTLIQNFEFTFNINESWQDIEDMVIKNVSLLLQPETLKEQMISLIKPIGLQILIWMQCNKFNLGITLPTVFSWTSRGILDEKNTVEILIKDGDIDVVIRYELACTYCLKDAIPELWKKIPESIKESFYYYNGNQMKIWSNYLVDIWTHDINEDWDRMDNMRSDRRWRPVYSYKYAVEHAASVGNKAAIEYFLQKLTLEESGKYRVSSATCVAETGFETPYTDVLFFLLSEMKEEEKIVVFESCPREVLSCFLYWPFQDFFMDMANRMWDFISEEEFESLLNTILLKAIPDYKDYNYETIFREFWQQSPDSYKKYVIGNCAVCEDLLRTLFRVKSKGNFFAIFRDATPDEREEIIFGCGSIICRDLIHSDEWDLLKFFICQCIASPETINEYKDFFRGEFEDEFAAMKDKLEKFFQILDDLICGMTKDKV